MLTVTIDEEWRMVSLLEDMAGVGLRCTVQSPYHHVSYALEDLERLLVMKCGTLIVHCLLKTPYMLDTVADYIHKKHG